MMRKALAIAALLLIGSSVDVFAATRFWVGGTGTWDGVTTTHWAASSGTGGGQSVPGSSDTVTFDGASGGGTVTVNTTVTVQSITMGAFTGTVDFSANNNNVTLSASQGLNNSGAGTRTLNMGNGTWDFTTTTAAATPMTQATTTGLTFNANSSIIKYSGAMSSGIAQLFTGGGLTYNKIQLTGSRTDSGLDITNSGGTITTLQIDVPTGVSFTIGCTVTTFTVSAKMTLSVATATTLTITNAPTWGSTQNPTSIVNSNSAANGTTATISTASGTFSFDSGAVQGMTFSGGATFACTNCYDLGKNSGMTITAPSPGGGRFFGG